MAIITAAPEKIRNVCLIGHGGNGKTSLAEGMLFLAKATDRLGKVVDGNTVCDYDDEEKKRKFSLSASLAYIEWKGAKINILDNPGYLDFAGEVKQSLRVSGTALIVMDAKSGVDVGCELAWDYATEAGVPKAFFINKMDDENARFGTCIEALREKFGVSVCPIAIPIIVNRKPLGFADLIEMKGFEYCNDGSVKEMPIPAESMGKVEEFRNMLMESLAETSDELMEKFFAGEEFTLPEMHEALNSGIVSGTIAPVMVGSSTTLAGVGSLLDVIAASFPSPLSRKPERQPDGNENKPDPNGTPAVFVFKTVADSFGKMSFFKVMNGKVTKNMMFTNLTTGQQEKFAKLVCLRGSKQFETDELNCGDIGVTTKLANTNTNDTLGGSVKYTAIKYPEAFYCKAIIPKAKGDEDKISSGIAKLLEEDRTVKFENNAETKQLCIYGLGEQHLDIILAKLKNRFGVDVNLAVPKIAYREAIKKNVDAEGKHKKQSGGHGQYGHVKIHFGPFEGPGLAFSESTVGGSVPKNFHPAVEKGLQEAMLKGVLAGFPMVGLKADLYDGSYHEVDSSEMSFKVAASLCYKEGMKKASPVLLEPVGTLAVRVPDSYVGDIISDVNKRRGRILGMTPDETASGKTIVEAEAPTSEMGDYAIALRALTQGRGAFAFNFVRYEEVPGNIAEKVIADNAANLAEEE